MNVNLWITDDGANLDPDSGGIIVYNKKMVGPGSQADFNNVLINNRELGIDDNKDKIAHVPHRSNRAVMFKSSLYHESDDHRFRNEYKTRRINLTLLWGYMEAERCDGYRV